MGTKRKSEEDLFRPRCGPWRAMRSQSSPVWTWCGPKPDRDNSVGELESFVGSARLPGKVGVSATTSIAAWTPPPVCFSVCATALGPEFALFYRTVLSGPL